MKLTTGETMCDIDGCVSLSTQMEIIEYLDGTHLCKYHVYLAEQMSLALNEDSSSFSIQAK